jgi:hypothetical protein
VFLFHHKFNVQSSRKAIAHVSAEDLAWCAAGKQCVTVILVTIYSMYTICVLLTLSASAVCNAQELMLSAHVV